MLIAIFIINQQTVNKQIAVAVKSLASSATESEMQFFKLELKLMANLKFHLNIVKFIGQIIFKEPMMIVTEYCSNGNLRDYLRNVCFNFIYINA